MEPSLSKMEKDLTMKLRELKDYSSIEDSLVHISSPIPRPRRLNWTSHSSLLSIKRSAISLPLLATLNMPISLKELYLLFARIWKVNV